MKTPFLFSDRVLDFRDVFRGTEFVRLRWSFAAECRLREVEVINMYLQCIQDLAATLLWDLHVPTVFVLVCASRSRVLMSSDKDSRLHGRRWEQAGRKHNLDWSTSFIVRPAESRRTRRKLMTPLSSANATAITALQATLVQQQYAWYSDFSQLTLRTSTLTP